MTEKKVRKIIEEEIENVKWGKQSLNEDLEPQEEREIRAIIRKEVSSIFFELFKKRKMWGA